MKRLNNWLRCCEYDNFDCLLVLFLKIYITIKNVSILEWSQMIDIYPRLTVLPHIFLHNHVPRSQIRCRLLLWPRSYSKRNWKLKLKLRNSKLKIRVNPAIWTQKWHHAVIMPKFRILKIWALFQDTQYVKYHANLSMLSQKRHYAVTIPTFYYFWNLGLISRQYAKSHDNLYLWTQRRPPANKPLQLGNDQNLDIIWIF